MPKNEREKSSGEKTRQNERLYRAPPSRVNKLLPHDLSVKFGFFTSSLNKKKSEGSNKLSNISFSILWL